MIELHKLNRLLIAYMVYKKKAVKQMGVFMGTKEASEKWGLSQSYISKLCRIGKIPGAEQDAKGSPWRIPADAEKTKG